MKNIHHHLAALATTLWVGGLWAIGYLAVPVLFHAQPDKQLAGMLAGQLFVLMGYVGIACGLYLMCYHLIKSGKFVMREYTYGMIMTMLCLSLLMQFFIQPLMADLKSQALPLDVMQSALAGRFKLWHGVSSILYLAESLLGAGLVMASVATGSKALSRT